MSSQILESQKTNYDNHLSNKNNPHEVTAAQIGAVPTSRTINNKSLSNNVILTTDNIVGCEQPLPETLVARNTTISLGEMNWNFQGGLFYVKRGRTLFIINPYRIQVVNDTTTSNNTSDQLAILPDDVNAIDCPTYSAIQIFLKDINGYDATSSGSFYISVSRTGGIITCGHYGRCQAGVYTLPPFQFMIPLYE